MSIEFEFTATDGVLYGRASGRDESLDDVRRYGLAVIEHAVAAQARLILLDERYLDYDLGMLDTYESACFMAETAPAVARVAIACAPSEKPEVDFWETVAVNRGLLVRFFTDLEEAAAWLGVAPLPGAWRPSA